LLLGTAAVALCSALAGCSFEHMQHRPGEHSGVASPEFDLQFIEADDEGWFWEPAQGNAALSLVEKAAAKNDTIVVLFVHGWHHSARCCDGNVEGFKEVLRRLRPRRTIRFSTSTIATSTGYGRLGCSRHRPVMAVSLVV
jgi:hypothetical protein